MRERAETPILVGDEIGGKYRVERVLGQGAMGMVVAARHLTLLELRAIKFMLPQALGNAQAVERFLREMRATVGLKSVHVAKVYDAGRLPTGAPYIVMEYLEGTNLGRLVQESGPLPIREALRHVLQASEAIAEAHSAGVIHRDIKPANLFLTQGAGGQPCIKVLDFGIAKLVPFLSLDEPELTTEEVIGTPSYMSPEQMHGDRTTDFRTDIWSLGATLYKLLTGQVPFAGRTIPEVGSSVLRDNAVPPVEIRPEIPKGLSDVILRCLEKDRGCRPASIAELAQALSAFSDEPARVVSSVVSVDSNTSPPSFRAFAFGFDGGDSPIAPPSYLRGGLQAKLRKRSRLLAMAGGAAGLVLSGLMVSGFLLGREKRGSSAVSSTRRSETPSIPVLEASSAPRVEANEALPSLALVPPSGPPADPEAASALAHGPPAECPLPRLAAPASSSAPALSAAAVAVEKPAKASAKPRPGPRRSSGRPAKPDGRGGDAFGFSRK